MVNFKALVVIDMLNDFVHPDGALYIGDVSQEVIANIIKEIEKANADNIPIIVVCDSHDEDDKEFMLFPKHCITNTWGAQIFDSIREELYNSETTDNYLTYINKNRYSAFFDTDLDETLSDLFPAFSPEVNEEGLVEESPSELEVIVVGVCTDICVLHTVEEFRNRDIKVIVPANAVASFDKEAHDWALKHMKTALGADVQ